ncbi:uncharacterized protein LOC133160835 isoform X1 [Syngnathus typhle]|uniref:uncharacterized protein LOC133160835 isoform X1 n=1 Tax=Syngnathus typhle TaxID=161592 RepID=UPI002A6996D0|nr:uncharacterized protein LOC133160835 isoform X1 [Syngnathus typhle]
MRKTFVSDDSMIINIYIRKNSEGRGHVMPREFKCVFRDSFKVFAYNGFPKPLGAAQCLAGVMFFSLGLIYRPMLHADIFIILPSISFVLCGMLTYAAGSVPNMRVVRGKCCFGWLRCFFFSEFVDLSIFYCTCQTKVSFCLNVISFLESAVLLCLCLLDLALNWRDVEHESKLQMGIGVTASVLLLVESLIALFLIYWESKAVCRQYFNSLPIIQLRQEEDKHDSTKQPDKIN